jgi:hypothetical protein
LVICRNSAKGQAFFFALFVVPLFLPEQRQPCLADLFFRLNLPPMLGAPPATRSWVHGLEWALPRWA